MGKSFKRNNSDSYKYGSNKKPRPKPKRHRPAYEETTPEQDNWREAFKEIIQEDDREPKRDD